jgi:dTDP-4-amino-4,6-dideoxygalactose transaminase
LYNRLLGDIDSLILPPKGSVTVHPVSHLYVVLTGRRDELKTWLESQGVSCGVHYALPIHLQPIYKELYGFKEGSYKFAEELCQTCLSIPIFPSISKEEVSYISAKIHEFFEGRSVDQK